MADPRAVHLYLEQLASSLVANGQPLQAVKCLEGLVGQSLLPVDEARCRLRVAKLLMDHTMNITEAKQDLLKAQLLVQKVPGQFVLKAEIAAQLAQSYQHMGEAEFQAKALADGLNLAAIEVSAADRPYVPAWSCYFHARLAENLLQRLDNQGALNAVEAGLAIAQEHRLLKEKLLFLLFKLHLCLLVWDRHHAEGVIVITTEAIQSLPREQCSEVLEAQLKLHFNVLQAVFNIKLGCFDEVSKAEGGSNLLVSSMEQLVASLEGQVLEYSWLPPQLHMPLVQLLAAIILKPPASREVLLTQVHDHINRGLAGVDLYLQQEQLQHSREEQLDHINIHGCRIALILKVLLLDCRFQLHLLSCQFAAARADVVANILLLQRFPTLLVSMLPTLHLESGMYAQLLGDHGRAAAHFTASRGRCDSKLHQVCCDALRALALLAGGGEGAVGAAAEALGPYYQAASPSSDTELGRTERALLLMASGATWLHQGEWLEAKQRLRKALDLAYKGLVNHHLVSQVMLLMLPAQMQGDVNVDRSSAKKMTNSSLALARGGGDLHTVVAALKVATVVLRDAAAAAENHNYLLKKQMELSERLQAADADEQERLLVLNWGLA